MAQPPNASALPPARASSRGVPYRSATAQLILPKVAFCLLIVLGRYGFGRVTAHPETVRLVAGVASSRENNFRVGDHSPRTSYFASHNAVSGQPCAQQPTQSSISNFTAK